MTTKNNCQLSVSVGSNPAQYNAEQVFNNCRSDWNPPFCKCALSRLLVDEEKISFKFTRAKSKRRYFNCFNFLLRFRLSSRKSFKFFLHTFLCWTLVFAPLMNDFLRCSFPLHRQLSIGGVKMVQGCHPGNLKNGGTRARPSVNQVPFQRNEFVPKMSEQTIGASGPAEGPIYRDSKRYNTELVANFNPDIVFRDEELTNEDRMMTQLCKDRLNVLAVAVLNQWPGVKLRVTEGWDDPVTEQTHPKGSLHYEGRAVDITTSDQDRSKYPILARLAVNAGFDWVLYKPSHVHCSVKSESSGAVGSRGCFPGDSRVHVPGNRIVKMSELFPGDQVYSVDSNGRVVPDTILTFMDINYDIVSGETVERSFVSVETDSGNVLRLTRNHLVHSSNLKTNEYSSGMVTAVFAGNLQKGDYIYVTNSSQLSNSTVRQSKIINITRVPSKSGAFAPLTTRGTILVDGTLASCYAVIESERAAHLAVSPLRYYYMLQLKIDSLLRKKNRLTQDSLKSRNGIHQREGILAYTKFLFYISQYFVPKQIFWGE